MTGYRDRFLRAGDLTLHLLDWGNPENPAVFLFHPTSGFAHVWDLVAEPLAGRYRVIALDARDHGDSDTSPQIFDPSIKADEVIELRTSSVSIDSALWATPWGAGWRPYSLTGIPSESIVSF